MKRKLLQFNFAFLLIIPLALYSSAYGQGSTKRRPRAKSQVREVMVGDGGSAVAALDGRGKLWAVVIGVSKYKNLAPKSQLEFANRDAEDFAAFLRSPKGGGYPPSQLTLLTNQAATLSAIRSALGTTLPRSVGPDDMVIIFFAGHGTVESERDGYLLAYDSDPQNLYATALQISELNRIVSERLNARNVILIADACHSGQLGMTSRGVGESTSMINRYLDEVGRSGKGIFRILASRQDQLSYEGKNWGNGHGAFTWFLLEGMRGQADDDKDGFVRVGELLKYLSNTVPKETQSLQTPVAAGEVDLSLPMAVVSYARPDPPSSPAPPVRPAPRRGSRRAYSQTVSVEVHGAPGLEVYMDNAFRGRVLPNGVLVIDQLNSGSHDLSIISAGVEPVSRKLSLSKTKTIVNINGAREITTSTESSPVITISSSPLVGQITQAISSKDINGAYNLYQQLVITAPNDPKRGSVESMLSAIFESIGQNAINAFVQSSGAAARPGMFQHAADAFRLLKIVTHNADWHDDAKLKFCEGKAMLDNRQFSEAAELFKSAIQIDPRAAYAYSALGLAYRELKKNDLAFESFNHAAELAPSWALPQIQMGFIYRDSGRLDLAREAFLNASRFDPNNQQALEQLMFTEAIRGELGEAEQLGNQIISKFPNSGLAYLLLARIYKVTDRRQESAEAYKKGVALPSDITPEQRADLVDQIQKSKKGKKKKKHNEY